MADYLVAVFTDLVKSSEAWKKIPQDPMASIMGEYTNIAEKTAAEFGHLGHSFTGDGHFLLFRNADAAIRFGLTLIHEWREAFQHLPALKEWDPIPLRVGAHFGVEARIGENSWVGRCGNTAKSIEGKADPNTLLVSEGMLDVIDLPLYEFSRFGSRKLKSDHIDSRILFRIDTFNREGFLKKPEEELTASDWFLRAAALIGTDRENTEEEERCYQKALELWPDYPEAHNSYGVLLKEQNHPKKAEEHFKEALRLRPDHPEAHNNYAILLRQDRPKEAEEHYKEALRLRPDFPEVHSNYGVLLRGQGRPKEAEEHYKEALGLRPDYPEAHNNYANLVGNSDRREEAEEHYEEALRLSPDYPDAHYNYAILLRQDRPKEAEEHYREALRLRPDNPDYTLAVEEEHWHQTPPDGAEEKS